MRLKGTIDPDSVTQKIRAWLSNGGCTVDQIMDEFGIIESQKVHKFFQAIRKQGHIIVHEGKVYKIIKG